MGIIERTESPADPVYSVHVYVKLPDGSEVCYQADGEDPVTDVSSIVRRVRRLWSAAGAGS